MATQDPRAIRDAPAPPVSAEAAVQGLLAGDTAGVRNHVLQLTDFLSSRRCTVRIDQEDMRLALGTLLDKYLKNPDFRRMRAERRITDESADTLAALQDLVYLSSDGGVLGDMFPGIAFEQDGRAVRPEEVLESKLVVAGETPVHLVEVGVNRMSVGYDRNWVGFNRRRWDRHADDYSSFVASCLEQDYGSAEAQDVLRLETKEQKLRLLRSVAKTIWERDFENYSRFTGKRLVYKTGDETVRSMMDGSGGICTEKVQALKFITDHYGLKSEVVIAGADTPDPVPETRLREILATFDFSFSKRYMRYWQHAALLYTIDGTEVLVDATNGNIPFLYLQNGPALRILGYESKEAVPVRMAVHRENFYYHRVPQDIPEKLFFALEGWIPYVDLVQVFDNELGLYISEDFFVTPLVFKSLKQLERLKREYAAVCRRAGLDHEVGVRWALDSPLGELFLARHPRAAEQVTLSREHLLARYDECHGVEHDAGLVIIRLKR